jgi:hypothetical protein
MNFKFFAWCILLALFAQSVSSCENTPTPNGDPLSQVWDAQDRATIAALTLQRAAGKATSQADATRESLFLIGQQTRLAQDARATQTTFAQNVASTATAQTIHQTATVQAGQFTATAHAQNVATTATTNAVSVASTREAASATAIAQAVIVASTREAASATKTSLAANAQATRTSNDATATVIAAQVIAAQEKADWERRTESARVMATFGFGALVLVGLAVIIGFAAIRFIDAGVLRARVMRDKTGTVFVIGERDDQGRQILLVPGRSPGAVINITPPNATPLQIEAGAVDEETTKRDQAISLMLAATSGKANDRAEDLLAELTEGEQIKIVDAPPAQLVNDDAAHLLNGQWKLLNDGEGN